MFSREWPHATLKWLVPLCCLFPQKCWCRQLGGFKEAGVMARYCGLPYGRDTAYVHCDSLNYESAFIE